MRETFISENSASCVGLETTEQGIVPVFGKQKSDYLQDFAIDLMQKAAVCYAEDFLSSFAKYMDILFFRNSEAGFLFEYFCRNVTEFDKFVFINHTIEDQVYSGFEELSLVYRWNENLQEIENSRGGEVAKPMKTETVAEKLPQGQTIQELLAGKSRWKKALFYWFFDRETFKRKMQARKNKKKQR